MAKEDKQGALVVAKFEQLLSARGNWETTWQDVADYTRPIRHNITDRETAGTKRMEDILNTVATKANERFANGLFGYLCRPDEQWFHFISPNNVVMKDEEVATWFANAEKISQGNMYLSGFAQEIHEDFMDLGTFGTSNLYVEAGTEYPLRFKNFDITSYVIEESAFGKIDTVIVKFRYNCRQAEQAFGRKNLPDEIQGLLDGKGKGASHAEKKKFTFYHCVRPNNNFKANSLDPKKKQYISLYVEKDSKKVVREGGYDIMPYAVARFFKDPNEVYGRSPAINAIGAIKMINAIENDFVKASHKRLRPPVAVRHGSVLNQPDLSAGKIVLIRGSMYEDKPVVLDTVGDVGLGLEVLKYYEEKIKESFYTDMFDYLEGGKYMTATEVEARRQSKLFLFAPMLARLQSEKLHLIVQNVFNILLEKGAFGEMPDALKENPQYEIQFSGKITNALRNIESRGTQMVLAMVNQIAQYDNSVLKNLNYNKMLRDEAINSGMPVSYIRPEEEVQAELRAEAEQARQAQEMAMAQQGSQVAKNLSGEISDNSVVGKVMQKGEEQQ